MRHSSAHCPFLLPLVCLQMRGDIIFLRVTNYVWKKIYQWQDAKRKTNSLFTNFCPEWDSPKQLLWINIFKIICFISHFRKAISIKEGYFCFRNTICIWRIEFGTWPAWWILVWLDLVFWQLLAISAAILVSLTSEPLTVLFLLSQTLPPTLPSDLLHLNGMSSRILPWPSRLG